MSGSLCRALKLVIYFRMAHHNSSHHPIYVVSNLFSKFNWHYGYPINFSLQGYSSNSPLRRSFLRDSLAAPMILIKAAMASATEVKALGILSSSEAFAFSFSLMFFTIT
ncbi:hypothetical protein QQP08_017681, partial [Theobroma cacao]